MSLKIEVAWNAFEISSEVLVLINKPTPPYFWGNVVRGADASCHMVVREVGHLGEAEVDDHRLPLARAGPLEQKVLRLEERGSGMGVEWDGQEDGWINGWMKRLGGGRMDGMDGQ
jgi:hypothetical protein